MTEREALKLALEALDGLSEPYDVLKAQEAIREALAQPEQEPVAITITGKLGNIYSFTGDYSLKKGDKVYTTQPQPEPVIDKSAAIRIATSLGWEPKRTWSGLTEEEQQELYDAWMQKDDGWGSFYTLIEAKLKEKNS